MSSNKKQSEVEVYYASQFPINSNLSSRKRPRKRLLSKQRKLVILRYVTWILPDRAPYLIPWPGRPSISKKETAEEEHCKKVCFFDYLFPIHEFFRERLPDATRKRKVPPANPGPIAKRSRMESVSDGNVRRSTRTRGGPSNATKSPTKYEKKRGAPKGWVYAVEQLLYWSERDAYR